MEESSLVGNAPVTFRFIWWIILLSFFVSLVGSVTTVEFLHRRRGRQGLISQLQLGACSVSFGLVAIWCMHFVGNRSIVLDNGAPEFQLYYNTGFTTLSAFLPIVFLYFGFFLVDRYSGSERAMYLSLIGTGLAAGLSITGMHYVGNLGASNYELKNKPGHIVGAAGIAVVACWFSFTMFFHQKEHWINSWYRRFLCAILLACAVSGMHWTATAGTKYYRLHNHPASTQERNRNVIVATALCMAALLCCISLMYITERRRREQADRAQHVVLAAFIIDSERRVLVTQDGLLPCQKITKQYNQRSFNDEFNVAHPVFQWIYRITHHWSGINDLIPTMRLHLRAAGALRTPSRPGTSSTLSPQYDGPGTEDEYSAIFREQFCVAAIDLADHLRIPLEKLGTLYGDILMTGMGNKKQTLAGSQVISAMESGKVTPSLFGKGQLLFVSSSVDQAGAAQMTEQGYRFTHIERIGDRVLDMMARGMQVKKEDLLATIQRIKQTGLEAADPAPPYSAGTHLCSFVLRPPLRTSHGWDLLVNKERPDELPSVKLSPDTLLPFQAQILHRLDGHSFPAVLERCERLASSSPSPQDAAFYTTLAAALHRLSSLLPPSFLHASLLCGIPVPAPSISSKPAHLYTFCAIADVHSASLRRAEVVSWTPLSFFRVRQRVLKGCPDHAVLARRNHVEFGTLLAGVTAGGPGKQKQKQVLKTGGRWTWTGMRIPLFGRSSPPFTLSHPHSSPSLPPSPPRTPSSSSEKGLFRISTSPSHPSPSPSPSPTPTYPYPEPPTPTFGGIMVSQDITVDRGDKGVEVEMRELGVRSEAAGGADVEGRTYADELFRVTCGKWAKG